MSPTVAEVPPGELGKDAKIWSRHRLSYRNHMTSDWSKLNESRDLPISGCSQPRDALGVGGGDTPHLKL